MAYVTLTFMKYSKRTLHCGEKHFLKQYNIIYILPPGGSFPDKEYA